MMSVSNLFLRGLLSCLLIIAVVVAVEKAATDVERTDVDIKVQRQAVKAWTKQLTEQDYNATHWAITMRHQPQNFFDHYVEILSDNFKEKQAKINFVLVGACDGTHDNTIRDRYLPNDHWRGVFVEPFEINYNDLVKFMEENGVADRTYVLHAAATRQCNSTMIKMKRPTFEEKNKSLPHWMRRQIGSVVPLDKLARPASGGWTFEMTRCVNGPDILTDWASTLFKRHKATNTNENAVFSKVSRIRPHILKVDVEGHDFEVLMGFLDHDTPNGELPLLISFEAKSIKTKFEELKTHLESRGYAVSHGGNNDGFALLKAPFVFNVKKAAGQQGEDASEDLDTTANKKGKGKRSGRKKRSEKGKKKIVNQD